MADTFVDADTGHSVLFEDGKAILRDKATGKLFRVSPVQAKEDLLSGSFLPATAEDIRKRELEKTRGGTLQQVATAAEGALSAIPGARSTVSNIAQLAELYSGAELGGYDKAARERAVENPASATTGRLVGEVGAFVAGDKGLSKLATAGKSASAVTRALGSASRDATIGAGLGLSSAQNEAFIQDIPLSTERALVGMGMGALLGGGTGLAASGAGALLAGAKTRLAPLTDRVGESASRIFGKGASVQEAANERALKAIGARGTDLGKLGTKEKIQQIGEDIRKYELSDGRPVIGRINSAESIAPKLSQGRAEVTAELDSIRNKVDESGVPATDAAKSFLEKVDKDVIAKLVESPSPTIRARAAKVSDELEWLRSKVANGDEITFSELRSQQAALKDVVYPAKPAGQGLPAAVPEHAESLMKAERALEEALETHIERVISERLPEEAGRYARFRRLSESFIKAEKISQKAIKQNLGNRFFSPTDYATGATATATLGASLLSGSFPAAALAGLGGAAVHKFVRERGNAFLARLATSAEKANSQLNDAVQQIVQHSKPVEALMSAAGTVRSSVSSTVKAFAVDGESLREAAQRRAQQVAALATDPLVMADTLAASTGDLGQQAPEYAAAVQATAARAVQYLHAQAPQNQTHTPLTPHMQRNTISSHDARRYAMQWEAATQPMNAIARMARGDIRPEQVDALKNVYPAVYADMRAKAIEQLATRKEPVSWRVSKKLDALLGLGGAADTLMTPGFQQRFEAAIRQAAQAEAQRRNKMAGGSSNIAQGAATTTQRLAYGK